MLVTCRWGLVLSPALATLAADSSVGPENDIFVGVTNGVNSWMSGRFFSAMRGYHFGAPGYGVSPTPLGIQQDVSSDQVHPFDVRGGTLTCTCNHASYTCWNVEASTFTRTLVAHTTHSVA
jgi:hypothetical protein